MTLRSYWDDWMDAAGGRLPRDVFRNCAEKKGFLDLAAREVHVQFGIRLRMNWVRILGDLRNRRFLLDAGLVLWGQLKSKLICIYQLRGGS